MHPSNSPLDQVVDVGFLMIDPFIECSFVGHESGMLNRWCNSSGPVTHMQSKCIVINTPLC